MDGMSRLLGQHGFIGRLGARTATGHRLPEHVAAERLRRLRQIDGFARQCRDHRRMAANGLDPLDRIAHRHGHDRGTVIHGGVDRS
jgi:hypothetical protein